MHPPTILLHSSKTMQAEPSSQALQRPLLLDQATKLHRYVASLSVEQLAKHMKISPKLAAETAKVYARWTAKDQDQSLAIDTFKGDIYSGLQAQQLTEAQRDYANEHLVILSGLYGLIRPYDGILPYRLEMMYKFPDQPYDNLYKFWGSAVAEQLPASGLIVNTSSVEYSKLVTPFVDSSRVVTPQFYTVNPKTKKPTFVTVHSKIARGAFARWMLIHKPGTPSELQNFNLLGYQYNQSLSNPSQPAFVTEEFGGIGLSIRLPKQN